MLAPVVRIDESMRWAEAAASVDEIGFVPVPRATQRNSSKRPGAKPGGGQQAAGQALYAEIPSLRVHEALPALDGAERPGGERALKLRASLESTATALASAVRRAHAGGRAPQPRVASGRFVLEWLAEYGGATGAAGLGAALLEAGFISGHHGHTAIADNPQVTYSVTPGLTPPASPVVGRRSPVASPRASRR